MKHQRKKFKPSPKRYHPKGISIIYEDYEIIVIEKIHGLLTVANASEVDNTVLALLNNYVQKGNSKSKNRVFVVHRLDRDTSGIMVFAKSDIVKEYLQHHWKQSKKTYFTVVHGVLNEKTGIISSYLTENKIHRVYSTQDRESGRLSKTEYKVIKESERYSLLEINLLTGRKNQIRVHFSERGNPVVGDKMYGGKEKGIKRLTLHAASLRIKHPATKEVISFETAIPEYFQKLVS